MHTEDKTGKYFKKIKFRNIGEGEIFGFEGNVYMRLKFTHMAHSGRVNAVRLSDGCDQGFDEDTDVEILCYKMTYHKIPDFSEGEKTEENTK